MRPVTPETIRALIVAECSDAILDLGLDPEALGEDFDLRTHGVIDSLGFLELVMALEEDLGISLDLGELPAEQLTVLGPLARAVAGQVASVDAAPAPEARP
jgi:acyl carrier protein